MGATFFGALVVAIIALFYSKRVRGGTIVPGPELPPGPAPEDEIPPMTDADAQGAFNQAQASSSIIEIEYVLEALAANGYENLARSCEAALNAYGRGASCTSASCINTTIEPALNQLGQLGFMGLFGILSVHLSQVVASGQ